MKWFRYILVAYLLVLTVVPCTDGLGHNHEGETVEINHHSHQHDTCSPFCSCACCKVNITQAQVPHISPWETLLTTHSFVFEPAACPVFYNIWQPPQV